MSNTIERKNDYVRPNDQWQNNPIENVCASCTGPPRAGVCCQQPAQCTPVRSVRSRRGIFVASCTALIIGSVIAAASSENRNEFFAPGPLTSHHATILSEKGNDRCATCHTNGNGSLIDWISAAVSSGKHIPIEQSQLCMDCHSKSICKENSLLAHNVNPDVLAQMTSTSLGGSTNGAQQLETKDFGDIACATCHKEHHGANFNLSMLTDNQCQTCHVRHIHSFERDHPEFKNWPFEEARNISFDHNTHGMKHFKDANVEFNCNTCHVSDPNGNVLKLAPFSQSCASCHEEQIVNVASSQPPSFSIFSLPMIDVQAIADAGLSVGQWPEPATGDFDGPLPPVMQVLLMADEQAAEVIERRGSLMDFSDLDPESQTDIQDAQMLAWSIKSLLHDLSVDGKLAVKKRLEKVTQRQLPDESLDGLLNGLDVSLFTRAQQRWLPELLNEISQHRQGREPMLSWVPSDRDLSGKLYPANDDVLAVNPIASLVQSTEANAPSNDQPGEQELPQTPQVIHHEPGQDQNQDSSGRINNPNIATETQSGSTGFRNETQQQDKQTLAENPLAALLAGEEPPGNLVSQDEPSKAVDEEDVASNDSVNSEGPGKDDIEQSLNQLLTAMANGELGPWQADDSTFSIDYRLTGHADVVMKSWIDWSALSPNDKTNVAFDSFHSELAKGNCRTCHSMTVESTAGSGFSKASVNWRADYRDPTVRDFTKFSHRPHLVVGTSDECISCHQLSGDHGVELGLSDFAVLSKSQCASCHHRNGAGDSCTSCHNYHVGSKVLGRKQ